MTTTDEPQVSETLIAAISAQLLADRHLLATAESCTGGWVAQSLTAVAGSSEWFDCGFVTYSNASKQHMLGIPGEILAAHGAVSEAVAARMAEGVLYNSRAHWALSITGIAGPGGGSAEKPVGMICFGWSNRDGLCETQTCFFSGNRRQIRIQAVEYALQGLLRRCSMKKA